MAVYKNHLAIVLQAEKIRLIATLEGFQGRSARGVGPNSTEAAVRAQYRPPTRIVPLPLGASWVYDTASIAFQLREGCVVSWQMFSWQNPGIQAVRRGGPAPHLGWWRRHCHQHSSEGRWGSGSLKA